MRSQKGKHSYKIKEDMTMNKNTNKNENNMTNIEHEIDLD